MTTKIQEVAITATQIFSEADTSLIEKQAPIETAGNEEVNEIKTSLAVLLNLAKVKKVYYIDDEHIPDVDYEIIAGLLRQSIDEKREELELLEINGLNLNFPDEEILPEYNKSWLILDLNQKKELLHRVLSLIDGQDYRFDITRAERVKNLFPDGVLEALDPMAWEDEFNRLNAGLLRGEKVLILFDQDLRFAGGKYATVKGENLIVQLKESVYRNRVICTLLTHFIPSPGDELSYRQSVVNGSNLRLKKIDFYALSKSRIDNSELLSDGIKKVLLNRYFERIKDSSVAIIKGAYKQFLKDLLAMDTYDFDDMILRSSYYEGVWEAETLFRIARNSFDHEVKQMMIINSYPRQVNKFIKEAKLLSDIRFNVDNTIAPYSGKLKLRHHDIYEKGEIINSLHQPIENGDIFSIYHGKEKGFYILLAQECDLMVRTKPIGTRSAKLATLLPIDVMSISKFNEVVKVHFEKFAEKNHYLASRFPMQYFSYGKDDVGVVNFSGAIQVDLDVLDLTVFNSSGEATFDTQVSTKIDALSTSWEERYKILKTKYLRDAPLQESLLAELGKIDGSLRSKLKTKIFSRLSPVKEVATAETYNVQTKKFSFGIKRSSRLKSVGAKYLLERYYRHMARTAEQHDFAESLK